jgi:signal transduction histidine kinase
MLFPLRSFRVQLLAATAATAVLGLLGANVLIATLQTRDTHASDRRKARVAARALAATLAQGAPLSRVAFVQSVLPDDQIIVTRRGRTVFSGPPLKSKELEAVSRASFPGGSVVIRRHSSSTDARPGVITGILALVVILVLGAAAALSTFLSRGMRKPIAQAIDVAQRVAGGDYSARLGSVGLEEFTHFARAFDSMAQRLEQSEIDQRRFLADVAHELATPVNALVGFATALADGTAATEDDRAEAALMIAHESARLQSLLRDLRDLTRIDLFESVHPEPVRLDRFCAEMAMRVRPLADDAKLELELELEPVEAVADPRVLESVVRNLLSNAIRYTPAHGSVTVWTARRGAFAALGVRDTGIGISPEHQSRIFDRLYRADEARSRTSGGSGLGLAIAQRATVALDGHLEVSSEPGRGSEFRVLLPRPAPHGVLRRH